MTKLIEGLGRLGLELSDKQIKQLEEYIQAVLEFNKGYNLMKADSADELAINHILDSLAGASEIRKLASGSLRIGDIGSGGGCPGIPLAVAFPEHSFTLVERMEKRCGFLNSAIKKMGLSNVKVLCAQADSVPKDSFDIEVFRAFHPFDLKIVSLLFGMLKKGGHLVAYKAREEKILSEMETIKPVVKDYQMIKLTVPFLEDHQRHLVIIKK